MTDLVSVVLPTHNRAERVVAAAASVLDQDLPALELVIVDDGSSDATVDVLDRLGSQDGRVRILRNDTPLGPCATRNKGLEVAQGELVAFCDDDDAWEPGIGPHLVSFLANRPDAGAVSCWHVVSHVQSGRKVTFRGPLQYGAEHLLWQNFVALPFAMVRRASLPFDIRFDPNLPTGEDWDLWLRCAQERPFVTVPEAGYVYSQHGGARVTTTPSAQVDGRRNFLSKHGAEMTSACRLFHEAVIAGMVGGRKATAELLASRATRSPRDVALVSALVAMSLATSRLGPRRNDPGLQARVMANAISRYDKRAT